jgi:hypothetical protein
MSTGKDHACVNVSKLLLRIHVTRHKPNWHRNVLLTSTCTHTHIHMQMHIYMHSHIHMHMRAGRLPRHLADEVVEAILQLFENQVRSNRCMHVYLHACMYARMHVCWWLFASSTTIFAHSARYVCVCVCLLGIRCACSSI